MEITVYTTGGKKSGSTNLPKEIFGLPWNADLVHQVVTSEQSNKRAVIAHAKDRAEVRGGGIKPWRQKGTGRARHGSNRSPIWIGGGVTHGPRKEKNYTKKINKKMRSKALFTILSRKLADNEIIFIDSLSFNDGKTREANDVVLNLSKVKGFENMTKKQGSKALFTLTEGEGKVKIKQGFENIASVAVGDVENLNALDALSYHYLVIVDPEKSLEFLKSKQKSKQK
ncbi:MAG: 50S ribosomal protein L4 [Candidatus Paceibacterota bacterium]